MRHPSTPSWRGRLATILLMLGLLLVLDSGIASAQGNCTTGEWTLNVDPSVPLCAYPLIVETGWHRPVDMIRAPDPAAGFPPITEAGTYIYPVAPGDPVPTFLGAYIVRTVNPFDQATDIVAPGSTESVEIGCCCCVQIEVTTDGTDCVIVNVRSGPCP